jgi:Zn-dependent protease
VADAEQAGERRERRQGLLMGRFFGIPIYVSPSWFLVALIITVTFEPTARSVADQPVSYLVALTYAVLLYASVLVHELSHSVVARGFGLPVRAITLHILGGVSEIEREPRTPGREFLIAFAGPLLSLVLAGGGFLVIQLIPLPPVLWLLAQAVTLANLVVGVFNLLPGLPLDGGRIVRAAVWKITDHPRRATEVAGWIGRGLAVVVVLGAPLLTAALADDRPSLLSVVWAALIGGFIWVGAGQAIQAARIRERIPRLIARKLARPVTPVARDVPLAEAIRQVNEAGGGALVVVDPDGRPTGIVDEAAVRATPEDRRPWVEVGVLARSLEPELILSADLVGEDLIGALRLLPATEYLLVEADGGLAGVLAMADVDRVFAGT